MKNKIENFNVASWVHVILNIACVSIYLTNFNQKNQKQKKVFSFSSLFLNKKIFLTFKLYAPKFILKLLSFGTQNKLTESISKTIAIRESDTYENLAA